jgi:DNA-binding response OmpR family regulator
VVDFKPATVLIVEDEWLIAEMLQEALKDAGFEIRGPAPRVSEALDLIAANGLDAAVLDVSLRGESSFPIARALAERAIPFAFMTGYVNKDFPEEFKDRPVLNKPVDVRKLVSCVQSLLAIKL